MKQSKFWLLILSLAGLGVMGQFLMSHTASTTVAAVTPIASTDSTYVDTSFTENTVDSVYLDAIEHLKSYEGFRSKIYYDVDGSRTIGYGHHLLRGENYQNISEELATEILDKDLTVRLEYIQDKYQVSGDTLLALGLFSFNCGTGTLAKAINHGILTEPTKLLQYCHYRTYDSEGNAKVHTSNKLLQRRKYELALIKKQ